MDPTTQEHARAKGAFLKLEEWAINPTVIHEAYHALVFKRKMTPEDAKAKLHTLIRDRRTQFLNITRTVSLYSLDIAVDFKIGGRDALIIGCYMHGGVERLQTHDHDLLELKKIRFKGKVIQLIDPIAK